MTARPIRILSLAAVLLAATASSTFAQTRPSDSAEDDARIRRTVENVRQRIMHEIQRRLGSTDGEFQVLEPRLETILQLQFEQSGRIMFMDRDPRGMQAAWLRITAGSDLERARMGLQNVLDDRTATPFEIEERLRIFRQAEAASRERLRAVQNELRDLLTGRQEAELVSMGILN